jgi:hypothetical protein
MGLGFELRAAEQVLYHLSHVSCPQSLVFEILLVF